MEKETPFAGGEDRGAAKSDEDNREPTSGSSVKEATSVSGPSVLRIRQSQ